MPYSLWPVDVLGLARHVLAALARGRALDPDTLALLRLLAPPPPAEAADLMAAFERQIEAGRYENLVKRLEKFTELEARVGEDAVLAHEWAALKTRFDLARYRNRHGVIRRRFSRERNFRDHLRFTWTRRDERFRILFDAFCHRWNLYGMEHDTPLIMKITVNPTPHGTMLFIPRGWSFDPHRDLDWREIVRLHRAHGAPRQGPKLSANRQERAKEKQHALRLSAEARARGLRGDARLAFILQGLRKHPDTDPSYLKRLLAC